MSKFRPIFAVVLTTALPLVLGGCPLAIVGGLAAAGGAGYAANQERGAGGAASDFSIKTNVQSAWIHANPAMQANLNVTVYEGRTLLTGFAPTPAVKARAQEIASRVPGVRVVYNEIEVAPPESAWSSTKDAWITTRVKSGLVFNGDVRSVNYSIQTVDRSVYLIGSARSQGELARAETAARYVPGVKRVVSYVEIRPGVPVAGAGPSAMPPPPVTQGSDATAAAPPAPVEVQKL